MWGADATATLTGEGQATIFIGVDHCTRECIGIHAALQGTRFEALEPVRQGVREHFGSYREGIASGLALRHDNGSQYCSHYFRGEMAFLGIESSPAYVREPEGYGVAERLISTLKEQLIWVQHFETVEDLQQALQSFKHRYNQRWLVSKHDYDFSTELSPALYLSSHIGPLHSRPCGAAFTRRCICTPTLFPSSRREWRVSPERSFRAGSGSSPRGLKPPVGSRFLSTRRHRVATFPPSLGHRSRSRGWI